MGIKFSNLATTTLASGVTNSTTTITVADGSVFPALGSGDFFFASIDTPPNSPEVIKVTAISSNTLTVVRGQDGTTATTHASGETIALRVVAAALEDLRDNAGETYTAGSGITLTGTVFSNSAPDQTVALTGSGGTTVSGTYPNFTISSASSIDGTTINPSAVQIGGTTVIDSSRNLTNIGTISSGDITISNSTPALVLNDTGNGGGGGAEAKILLRNTGGDAMGIGYTANDSANSDMIISTNAAGTFGGYLGLDAAGIADAQADIILEPKTNVRIATGSLEMGSTVVIDSSRNLTAQTGTFTGQNATALTVNSGTTNVAAKFESSDDEVWINLKDNNSGTYGALLGHGDDFLFKIADNAVNIRMSLSAAGLLDTDAGYSVAGTTVINSSRNLTNVGTISSGAITSTGDIRLNGGNLTRNAHNTGHLEGSYNSVGSSNSTASNPIYTIGSSYNPATTTLSNMYGIGFTKGSASFITGDLDAGANNGWGLYVAADGDARVWLNGTNGIISSTGQHYADGSLVWNAGNDGSGSGLDADLLDGLNASTSATANTVVARDAGGDVSQRYGFAVHFNQSSSNSENPVIGAFWTNSTSDNYNRKSTPAHVISHLGLWTSGNDGSGSGLDADLLDGLHASSFTSSDHFKWRGTSNLTSTTTSALKSELLARDVFDSSLSAFKTSWSYAGNGNLTDAGRFTEMAGTSWLTWTDNSADNTYGNFTALAIAPNTGGSAGKVFIYNDQGSGYAPGWREVWTSTSDGSGSGLDADLLDGSHKVDIQKQLVNVQSVTAADSCLPSTGYGFKHFLGLGPSNNDGHILGMTWSGTTAYGAQIYVDTDPNNIMAFRSRSSTGVWTSWNTVWHTGNDGSGSGLDADLLDGVQGSSFLRSDTADTMTSTLTVARLKFTGEGGNSNVGNDRYAIFQEAGAWSHPYPDLIIGFHTGIKIGGHRNYNGTRFYNDNPLNGSEIFSVGNGDNHVRVLNNLKVTSQTDSYSYIGNANVAGTGNASYHPSGIYSTGTNWLYGTLYYNGNDSYYQGGSIRSVDDIVSDQNYGYGLVGLYSATRYQHVWSMGAAYRTNASGTSYGNMYGLTYTHTNIGTGTNQAISGLSHQLQHRTNGTLTAAIGSGIWTSGNVTAYSDIAVKTNLVKIPNALEKVCAINGYTYERTDYVKDPEDKNAPDVLRQAGVVAQEVEKVLPEVVSGDEGNKAVAYGNIVSLLIEAIKEQQGQIEDLKQEIQALKGAS